MIFCWIPNLFLRISRDVIGTSRVATFAILECTADAPQNRPLYPRRGDGHVAVELPANRYPLPFFVYVIQPSWQVVAFEAVCIINANRCAAATRRQYVYFFVSCIQARALTDSSCTSLCPRFESRPSVPRIHDYYFVSVARLIFAVWPRSVVIYDVHVVLVRPPVFDVSLFILL